MLRVTFAGSILKDDVVEGDVTSYWRTSGGLKHDLGVNKSMFNTWGPVRPFLQAHCTVMNKQRWAPMHCRSQETLCLQYNAVR